MYSTQTEKSVVVPYAYPGRVKYSYQWPPSSSGKTRLYQDAKHIDRAFCGQDRCRFLLPVAITEQESKAQMHFRQLAFLAGQLNRTIVLPNVYHSHMGSCLPYSFDFYYDQEWLDRNDKHFKYITMAAFKQWIEARHQESAIPTGQEIYVQGSRKSKLLKRIKNCFYQAFDFSQRPVVNYQFLDHSKVPKDINLNKVMTSLLSDQARHHESALEEPVDVINLYYDRRYMFLHHPQAARPLSYNPHWSQVANQIVEQLKPFIAIHWRMERLEPVSNLLPCAKNLVEQVQQMNHTNVFLLTDYPHLLNNRPESNSFRPSQLVPEHHQAIEYLYRHLNVTLTAVAPVPSNVSDRWHVVPIQSTQDDRFPQDKSVLGIVDKLVAMQAQWFFAGKPDVCAKRSSFTARIIDSRKKAMKHHTQGDLEPVKTFDISV
ncbi:hypothetical protein A0J61_03023 [Choanephora cucurbitarum]|uniref:Uncharacterized protein n=1 Tax=Choanephora cucurbitarum TaxID=101091 RepID=A0A1C7NKB5_9FUNG|nr:hypothetical protein A0J61_03023 [Choanephora cucurbitarum]